ncbi:uncharacterized protein LOC109842532 [Asparagus officinalis]|uniref:uncharacterized protein LOC109842532 n=1 Tax=Asparagus officinalis TaxID=4686 RepID=UPI00098E6FB7|nr:uncharacterized protein LOC109842532 [Asparagus officinalis]
MNLYFWNIRGLNKSSKQHLVKLFIAQYHLSFIALLETKISDRRMPIIAKRIAKDWNCITNTGYASKIRIMILWDPNVLDINFENFSAQQITCTVKSLDGSFNSVISTIYGLNHIEGRKDLWNELRIIQNSIGNSPWLLCGDFNSIISNDEKLGGSLLTEADFKDFNDFIQDSMLNHLKTIGCFYTWNNKQDDISRIWCSLDRALVNDSWIHNFNSSQVEFLLPSFSDHSPALVSILEDRIQGKRPFKYFNMWAKHDKFLTAVSSIWQSYIPGCKMYSVHTKFKNLKGVLKDMNKRHFHNISEQVLRANQNLEEAQHNLQANPLC